MAKPMSVTRGELTNTLLKNESTQYLILLKKILSMVANLIQHLANINSFQYKTKNHNKSKEERSQ